MKFVIFCGEEAIAEIEGKDVKVKLLFKEASFKRSS